MVHIGCKYTGRQASHIDTTSGVYWQVLPSIEGDAALLQAKMLSALPAPKSGRFGAWFKCTARQSEHHNKP